MRTSEEIGLPEANRVTRWMFLVVLRICVYGPPPILTKMLMEKVLVATLRWKLAK